jgi:hypothetical protein
VNPIPIASCGFRLAGSALRTVSDSLVLGFDEWGDQRELKQCGTCDFSILMGFEWVLMGFNWISWDFTGFCWLSHKLVSFTRSNVRFMVLLSIVRWEYKPT